MTLHDYLTDYLVSIVMIELSFGQKESFQYNYWNWFHQLGQLHLLKDDLSIGHILHGGSVNKNNDGSVSYESKYFPKKCLLNFYYGGVTDD